MSGNDLKLGKLFQERKNKLYLFLYSFICFTSQLQFPLPFLLPFPLSPPPSFPPQSTPLLFLFRKGQASHGAQQRMVYQVAVKLSNAPFIKACQSNPRVS